MKKINNTDYMNNNPTSGSMIYDKDLSEKIKEEYKNKNLNETYSGSSGISGVSGESGISGGQKFE
jgi:hypothetical protein